MFVADASVHIADMRPSEPHHREARAFLDHVRQTGEYAYQPIIVLVEVAAGIARGTGRPGLARRLTGLLRRIPNFIFVPVDDTLGKLAAEIAASQQIRGCDAVCVALAQVFGSRRHENGEGHEARRSPRGAAPSCFRGPSCLRAPDTHPQYSVPHHRTSSPATRRISRKRRAARCR
jgi:predicted nucleic acid-binding protein